MALPVYPQTPQLEWAICTAANDDLSSDPNNTELLCNGGALGAEVVRVEATPRAAVASAGVLRLYASKDEGTTKVLFLQIPVPTSTVGDADAPEPIDFGFTLDAPLHVGAGVRVYVAFSRALAAGMVVRAEVLALAVPE